MQKVIHFYYTTAFTNDEGYVIGVHELMDIIVYENGKGKLDFTEGAVYQYLKEKKNTDDVDSFIDELEKLSQPLDFNGEVQTTIKINGL